VRTNPGTSTNNSAGEVALSPETIENATQQRALLRGLLAVAAGFSTHQTGPFHISGGSSGEAAVFYCLRGSGWLEAGARLHKIRKGDLVMIAPGSPFAAALHASSPWTIHWVRAVGDNLPDYFRELGTSTANPGIRVGEDSQVVRLFNEILSALRRGASFASLLHASHALAYLFALLVEGRAEAPAASGSTQKVGEAIIYMSEHLHEPLRVVALAQMAGLSPDYFAELFKQQTGCSPRDYLQLLRVHRACQLLQSTSLNVKEIAGRLGYVDPFHFSRQFKAFQGVSPSEYRAASPSQPP
jgi:AraC-like DNA-binding protein